MIVLLIRHYDGSWSSIWYGELQLNDRLDHDLMRLPQRLTLRIRSLMQINAA
jgi:hypothetical protein